MCLSVTQREVLTLFNKQKAKITQLHLFAGGNKMFFEEISKLKTVLQYVLLSIFSQFLVFTPKQQRLLHFFPLL